MSPSPSLTGIHIPLVSAVAATHSRHAGEIIVVKAKLTARTGFKAASTANIAWIICPSRDLIPLQR